MPLLHTLVSRITSGRRGSWAASCVLGLSALLVAGLPWAGKSQALATWTLGDLVWHDLDGDGLQDEGEPGVTGIEVALYKNGTCSGATPFKTTATGSDGKYGFAELQAGRYCIWFLVPLGWSVAPAGRGNDEAKDSDADPQTAKITDLNLTSNDLKEDIGLLRRIYMPLLLRTPVVVNGGFESGDTRGWQIDPDTLLGTPTVVTNNPHTGSHSLRLGDPGFCNTPKPERPGDHVTAAWQELYVPNRSGTPRLQFHYRILTYDHITWTNGKTLGDSLDVYVGGQLALRDSYENYPQAAPECTSLQDSGWRTPDDPWFQEPATALTLGRVDQQALDLSEWKGQPVTVRFEVWTRMDGYDNTWAYLDDVQVVFE